MPNLWGRIKSHYLGRIAEDMEESKQATMSWSCCSKLTKIVLKVLVETSVAERKKGGTWASPSKWESLNPEGWQVVGFQGRKLSSDNFKVTRAVNVWGVKEEIGEEETTPISVYEDMIGKRPKKRWYQIRDEKK